MESPGLEHISHESARLGHQRPEGRIIIPQEGWTGYFLGFTADLNFISFHFATFGLQMQALQVPLRTERPHPRPAWLQLRQAS